MSFIEITRTLRSLTQAPGRLFLTLLGIVIGSAAIVLVMSLLEGGKSALIRTNQGVTGADLVVVSGKRLPERARLLGRPELSRADGTALAKTRLLQDRSVHADASRDTRAYFRGKNKRVRVVSGNPRVAELYRVETAKGRFLVASDLVQRRRVCVVGDEIYEELLRRAPLDRELALSIDGTRWQIVGVLKKKPMIGSTTGTWVWGRKVVVPETSYDLRYAPEHGADRLIVRAGTRVRAVRSTIRALVSHLHAGAENFELDDPSGAKQEELILSVIGLLLLGTGVLALFVGGINVMNVMLVRVTERTREIGLRRALGATRGSILRLFLAESVLLSGVGGFLGVLLGSGLAALCALGLSQVFGSFPIQVSSLSLLLGAGLSLVTGVVFGVLPAWRAAKLDPVVALRVE
ncbi:MAG: ABC transporter permease [Myxococcales bacterium]|nr:ABC transporter permease [Myxococcales bacterium]MCB9581510.1 ABC transporter permease [Polyangiaceae bacterium]